MNNLVENKGETNFKSVHLWTDVTCICNWVLSDKIHNNRFIGNRVQKSKEIINELNVQVHHIPGLSNPADLLTKYFTMDYSASKLWNEGPDILLNPNEWVNYKETAE